jgi:alpha-N-arabinofuranosidase
MRAAAFGVSLGLVLALLVSPRAAERQAQPAAAVHIDIDAGHVEGRISPLLYGQFMEFMFEGIKGGLHAELLRNRSFEEDPNVIGLSRRWERYPDDRDDDYGLTFQRVEDVAYPARPDADGTVGGHSQKVQIRPAVIARHGVYQAPILVRPGIEYRGYLWMKTEGFKGDVRVALESQTSGGRIYAETALANVSGDWKRYPFVLSSTAADPQARFAILFSGEGTVWVDQASLMPSDAVDGVRGDVLSKVKALSPRFLRWPGGNVAQDYHWRWGVGPRDERPLWVNLSWKNEIEPSDFGTDEFIQFARNAGAEPTLTVNVEGRGATVAEAAAWVEYCNGPATSTNGAMRARNGHPEPYHVKYWEIGNEIWGDWVRAHSDAATYARNLTRYAAAMRAVDPSITLIAVGDNDMAWNRTVLGSGERFEYLAIHHYYGQRDMAADPRNLMARPLHYDRFYGEVDAMLREQPADHRPQLAINEWGLDLPESQQYSILGALYAARLMNVFERHGDLVGMSAVSDLVNGWPGGIIQAARDAVFVTPAYLVNRLYATRVGAERLATRVDGPTFSSSREGDGVPVVDVVTTRSADGRRLFIKAVNTDLEHAVSALISVHGARVASKGTLERVQADSMAAVNSFRTPDAVRFTTQPLSASNALALVLPSHSVSVITLDLLH